MPKLFDRIVRLAPGAALVALLLGQQVGCASMRAASAKHAYVEKQTANYVYSKPLGEVWPEARKMLFSGGYEVKDTDASNAETEWKVNKNHRTRYLLSGVAVDDNSCKIEFTRAEEQQEKGQWSALDTDRDLKLEHDLIKKVEPERAKQIDSEAEAEGEKAKKG